MDSHNLVKAEKLTMTKYFIKQINRKFRKTALPLTKTQITSYPSYYEEGKRGIFFLGINLFL